MARVQRTVSKVAKGGRRGKVRHERDGITLPTEPVPASGNLNDFSFLIYGPKKVGKTTFALEGGRVLLINFDPPQITYERMEVCPKDWDEFLDVLKQLEKLAKNPKTFPYDRVVIDRVDLWYDLALDYACQNLGIDHPSEEKGFGRGWKEVEKTFAAGVRRILALPCGRWFLTHATTEEEENRHGHTITKLVPILSKQADKQLNGRCDGWFAYTYEGSERILVVRGDERTGAGHHVRGHFRTPRKERVEVIPMGEDESESWQNFVTAFENKQESVDPVTDPDVRPRRRVKKGGKPKVRRRVRA